MPISRQNLLIGVLAILLLGGAYIYFFGGKGSQAPLTATAGASSPAEQQFLDLAGQLTSITFDTSILSDPRFASLVDIATPIAPENTGRTDPFAPLPR